MAKTPIKSFAVGELKHAVTIQAPPRTLAVTATDIETSVPMKIAAVPLAFQAREYRAAGGLQASTVYTVTCRYREDILQAYTLVEECCTQRTFQILAIIPSDRRDALDMTCVTNG